LQGRPADHTTAAMAAPNDCAGCHTTANWNSNTMPAGHMPNPANTACNVCHITAPASYKTLAANSVLHTGISSNCGLCHGGTAGALTWYNAFTPKAAVLAPAHIPYLAGTDCSGCHSSNSYAAGTFGPMNMTQAKHSFVPTSCNTCHEKGLSFYMGGANPGLQGRPADHTSAAMSAPNDCGGCHTTANWNSNTLPAGHMPNPANDACTVCHINTANYKILAANSVLHTGISSNCGQCHGGTTPLTWYNAFTPVDAVLSPAHIPYLPGADCSACHSSSTYAAGTFGPSNMTQARHAFVTTNCVTCHEKGVSFYMGAANPALQGRPADHTSGTMLTGNCGSCHTTANWNSGSLPAGHMPNPGNQGCSVCHIAAPANYKTLAANAVLHTGIGSGCITCHAAPNAAPLVFYLNFTPKAAAGLAPPHIPTSSTPCESCHTISFTSFSGTTMSAAKHTTMLSVTGGTCDQCHGPNTLTFYGVNNLTTRPGANHGGGRDCNGCHSPNSWNGGKAKKTVAAAKTPTRSTIGTVVAAPAAASTQAGAATTATPQTRAAQTATPQVSVSRAGAIQSGRSIGAGTGTVSHTGVTSNCASCHNGVLAAGKGPTHIASNNTCQNCHTTIAWLPARFDHQGVTASCASCHNGVVALGKPTLHVQTNQDCGACHGTITWRAVRFSHVGISAMCQSCHNGITATGKQVQHVRTTLDCGSCHNTLNWTIVNVPARPRPLIPSPRGAPSGPTK
jgi:nitrate/TMAO reductase-like tetraheme cytochrome c subunit